jgi:hypothetical protein
MNGADVGRKARERERAALARLEPFGNAWIEFDYRTFTALSAMTDDELRQVIKDTDVPDMMNCWFATFEAAPFVKKQARQILYDRQRQAAAPATTKAKPKRKQPPGGQP